MNESAYASFLLRLWREPAADVVNEQEPAWMGEIESIQTGRAWQFQGLEPLLELLAAQLASSAASTSNREKPS